MKLYSLDSGLATSVTGALSADLAPAKDSVVPLFRF
jgi:hypothetical protein